MAVRLSLNLSPQHHSFRSALQWRCQVAGKSGNLHEYLQHVPVDGRRGRAWEVICHSAIPCSESLLHALYANEFDSLTEHSLFSKLNLQWEKRADGSHWAYT